MREKRYAESVGLFRRAAELGHAAAMCNLGGLYRSGRGVEQDDDEAAAWYRKAADAGNSRAKAILDRMNRE